MCVRNVYIFFRVRHAATNLHQTYHTIFKWCTGARLLLSINMHIKCKKNVNQRNFFFFKKKTTERVFKWIFSFFRAFCKIRALYQAADVQSAYMQLHIRIEYQVLPFSEFFFSRPPLLLARTSRDATKQFLFRCWVCTKHYICCRVCDTL